MLGAIAAAWWPGRMVARLPVVLALSGRPPKPRPARHAAIAAAALIAAGIGCLALSDRDRPPLIVAGTVATIVGCLLLGPAAIRIFSGLAGRLSIGPRLALRDLVRHQARSGAALAAVTLALGIAATVVIVASAEHAKDAAEPPNLSDRQIRVYLGSGGGSRDHPAGGAETDRPSRARASRRSPPDSTGPPWSSSAESFNRARTPRSSAGAAAEPEDSCRPSPHGNTPARATAPARSSSSPRPRCSPTWGSIPRRSIRARTSSPTAAFRPNGSSSRASWTGGISA